MGYIYISLSAFFFCLMTVFVKIAGQELETVQIVFTRGIITLLFTLVMIKSKKVYLWGENHKILILRGIIGTIALFFVYESIQRFPLPEATVIQYLYPIFTALLASFFISEHVGNQLYFAIILGFLGLGVQPPRPSLGVMLSETGNLSVIRSYPWMLIGPGLVSSLLLLCWNILGDSLNDVFNPRTK